jgi:hypothetical protein
LKWRRINRSQSAIAGMVSCGGRHYRCRHDEIFLSAVFDGGEELFYDELD